MVEPVDAANPASGDRRLLRRHDQFAKMLLDQPGIADTFLRERLPAGVAALLIGIEAPPNYGADYRSAFNAIYPDLGAAHDVPVIPSMLGAIVAAPDPLSLMQPDGIHPNAQGVRRIVEAIGPQVLAFVESLGACAAACRVAAE